MRQGDALIMNGFMFPEFEDPDGMPALIEQEAMGTVGGAAPGPVATRSNLGAAFPDFSGEFAAVVGGAVPLNAQV